MIIVAEYWYRHELQRCKTVKRKKERKGAGSPRCELQKDQVGSTSHGCRRGAETVPGQRGKLYHIIMESIERIQ